MSDAIFIDSPERAQADSIAVSDADEKKPPGDEGAVHQHAESPQRLSESGFDCMKTLALDGTILSINENGLRLLEIADAREVCGVNWASFFSDHEESQEAFLAARDAAAAGGTGRFQGYCPTTTGKPKWWDTVILPLFGADGMPEKLISTSRDITARREAERNAGQVARQVRLITDAAPLLIAYLDTDLRYQFVNKTYEEWFGLPSVDIVGRHAVEIIGPAAFAQVQPRLLAALSGERAFYEGEMPYKSAGRRYVDIQLVPDVAEDGASIRGFVAVLTDITGRKQLERERERLLIDERTRAAREALLNQIGTAVRGAMEPEAILQAAVSTLGQGLGADRCYVVRTDLHRDSARVFPEWIRDGSKLDPFVGRAFLASPYAVNRNAAYQTGKTHILNDVLTDSPEDSAALQALDLRSLVRVPINAGSYGTGLTVAMAHEPRVWTAEEVRLIENVASLVRSALESARAQQRERNISQQLQDALIPLPPADLPGLALASFYRPALAEAEVGGDFFDVFNVEDGCTALVVADLSGKGLAAASEVSTVRNMLRYALYSAPTLAGAITGLHSILVKHGLLTGFATLFVGIYDDRENKLTYVNGGQEPGLIWRAATGDVEIMPPTGSVLGGFGDCDYEEAVITLSDGDVFALFTDGLTEVGPNRKEQLDVGGVIDILRDCCTKNPQIPAGLLPPTIVQGLIAGVDNFARGGARDDIALLVGTVHTTS